jgi:Ca2+/H+ antiporter, TMEM165/GDT1 family
VEVSSLPPQLSTPSEAQGKPPVTQPSPHLKGGRRKVWGIFASTFFTIFLAEMGDKTQITTMLMTAESHNPWVVFLGAGTALVTTSLLGVLLGQWLATRVEPKTIEKAAGVSLLLIAATLVWDILIA